MYVLPPLLQKYVQVVNVLINRVGHYIIHQHGNDACKKILINAKMFDV